MSMIILKVNLEVKNPNVSLFQLEYTQHPRIGRVLTSLMLDGVLPLGFSRTEFALRICLQY